MLFPIFSKIFLLAAEWVIDGEKPGAVGLSSQNLHAVTLHLQEFPVGTTADDAPVTTEQREVTSF